MITISYICPQCKAIGYAEVAETTVNDALRWYRSFTCSSCGLAEETDDMGRLPEEYRQLELKENDIWMVKITCPLSAKILSILRIEGQLALSDIEMLKRQHQENYIVAKGTKAEMTLLKTKLSSIVEDNYLVLTQLIA